MSDDDLHDALGVAVTAPTWGSMKQLRMHLTKMRFDYMHCQDCERSLRLGEWVVYVSMPEPPSPRLVCRACADPYVAWEALG